jgi:transposase
MEIITGVERRRRWSLDEKLRIVAETERPNTGIALASTEVVEIRSGA